MVMRVCSYSSPWIISKMLTYAPVKKPRTPKQTKNMFFQSTQLKRPRPFGLSQKATVSITAGKMRPRNERQTAPTNEMKGPRFGIAIAVAKVRMMIPTRMLYSARFFLAPNQWRTFFQIISMGT